MNGWRWDDDMLVRIVQQFAKEDVWDPCDLRGVLLEDISDAAEWHDDVRSFVAKLCMVHMHVSFECLAMLHYDRVRRTAIAIS